MSEIQSGDYILWFAHYGSLEYEKRRGPLEDIVKEVADYDDEDTHSYDSHGIPLDLELVGSGVVENFDALVEARRAEIETERKAAAAEYARKRAAEPVDDRPKYHIYLSPPTEHKQLGRSVCVAAHLPMDKLVSERDRLEAIFGKDRITVKDAR
jgi:uncharacterized protein YcaQ